MTFFSVIIATKGRPSLYDTLKSLKKQTFKDFEVLTIEGYMNEYEARNVGAKKAKGEVLAFIDDDALATPNWLQNAYKYFQNPEVMVLSGVVEGDVWGWGKWLRIDKPYWFIGCNLFVRKSAFWEVGGFEVDWGLGKPVRGWRSDTAMGYKILDRFGRESYVHATDVVVHHPKPMGSVWVPEIEAEFYRRYRKYVLRYIAPYDPRICQFVVINNIERDDRVRRRLMSNQKPRLDWLLTNAEEPILDVGSGEGLTFIPHATEMDVVHFDIDLYAIENFVRGDALHLPFRDNSFRTVVVAELLEHVPDPLKVLMEALRVSNKLVLATVPNEYEWKKEYSPCISREERMRQDGFTDVDEMAKHFVGSSPYCKDIVSEKKYPHLWHVRWFTEQELAKLLSNTGKKYEIGYLRYGGWSHFTIKIFKART